MRSRKKVIIGIDGVPYGLMESLSEKGVMSNFKDLKSQGVFRKMRSSIPEISSVAWSSIITGKNPGEHNVYGFTEIIPGTYSLAFPDFNWLKAPAFWHRDSHKKHVIINVPSTYPVQPLNGAHISGFISLDLESAVYPQDHLPKLKEYNYQVDVDSGLGHESKVLFLQKLAETNEARIKTYRHFWKNEEWDVFMLVFTGSDRLGHFLWDAYEDESHKYHQDFLNYFRRVDEVIGEIAEALDENDSLMILSDHGMERIKNNFFLNKFLQDKGLLELDEEQKGYNKILSGTRAFTLDPGRIYVHKTGKYPRGSVGAEEEEVIKNLVDAFEEVKYHGEKVIRKIYRKGEIYSGPYFENAPDLVLVPSTGFRLRGTMEAEKTFGTDIFAGDHTLDNAFLFVRGAKNISVVPERPTVEDVVSIFDNI